MTAQILKYPEQNSCRSPDRKRIVQLYEIGKITKTEMDLWLALGGHKPSHVTEE